MAEEGPELQRCPLTSKCPRKFQTSPGEQASCRDTAVASAQWMKARGWGGGEPVPVERESVMWEEITGLGVRVRVSIRQGCDSLAQCEGLGVDVWVLGEEDI